MRLPSPFFLIAAVSAISLSVAAVWSELIAFGTAASIDKSWAMLFGASTVTYLLGKSGESLSPTVRTTT